MADDKNSIHENKNSDSISRELIDLLIRSTQQAAEQSTLVRTALNELGSKLDEVLDRSEDELEAYRFISDMLSKCPLAKDDIIIQRMRVDIENLKLNVTEMRKENRDFMEELKSAIIEPYTQYGGFTKFFSNIMYRYAFLVIMTCVVNIIIIAVLLIKGF